MRKRRRRRRELLAVVSKAHPFICSFFLYTCSLLWFIHSFHGFLAESVLSRGLVSIVVCVAIVKLFLAVASSKVALSLLSFVLEKTSEISYPTALKRRTLVHNVSRLLAADTLVRMI